MENTEFEDNCSYISLKKASLIQSTSGSQLLTQNLSIEIGGFSSSNQLEIRRIRVYTNCVQNCNVCYSNNSCKTCIYGFQRVLQIDGNYLCEQTFGCSSIAGCFSCVIDSQDIVQCLKCLPGYIMNSSNYCDQITSTNQCLSNQQNQCLDYSIICSYEDRYGQYVDCDNISISKIQTFKCPSNKQVLVLAPQNNEFYNCVCKIKNCSSCSSLDTCQKCMDGFYLSNNKCIACFDTNCKECSSYNICLSCYEGYIYDPNVKFCYEECPTGYKYDFISHTCVNCLDNCIDCSPTQCFRCINDYFYEVDPNDPQKCFRSQANSYKISQKLTNYGYEISLIFIDTIDQLVADINSLVDVKLSKEIKYQKSVSISQNLINISLNMTESCKEQQASILIKNSTFYSSNFLNQNNTQIKLSSFVQLTDDQKVQSQNIASVGNGINTSMLSTFIPITILSNFYILINTIDLTGYLYYLLFIDIRYPQNVLSFFDFFKNFQFPFIPNYFTGLVTNGYQQDAPPKFLEMQNDGYFLNSAGQSLTIVAFFIIVYLTLKALSLMRIKYVSPYLKGALKRAWEFGSFFDILCTVYIYILMGVLLQFRVYEFTDRTYHINYILHSFWACIVLPIPFFIIWILHIQKNLKSNQEAQVYLSSIVGGIRIYDEKEIQLLQKNQEILQQDNESLKSEQLKDFQNSRQIQSQVMQSTQISSFLPEKNELSNFQKRRRIHMIKYSRLLNGLLYLRKLLFSLVIVYLYEHQYIQIAFVTIFNLSLAFFIFYIHPYENKSENIKNAFGEIFLVAIYITSAFLVEDEINGDEQQRFNIGWIIISLSAFIILWNTIGLLYESFKSIILLVTKPCRKKSNKVVPQNPPILLNGSPLKINEQNAKPYSRKRTLSTIKIKPVSIEQSFGKNENLINNNSNNNELNSPKEPYQMFSSVLLCSSNNNNRFQRTNLKIETNNLSQSNNNLKQENSQLQQVESNREEKQRDYIDLKDDTTRYQGSPMIQSPFDPPTERLRINSNTSTKFAPQSNRYKLKQKILQLNKELKLFDYQINSPQ